MDFDIQINDPVLINTEYFLVRYRLAPNGVWVDLGVQTNALFTITGIGEGQYELEVRVVNQEGIICPAVIREFEVPADPIPCVCPELTELYVTKMCDNTRVIHMAFDGQGSGVCQFDVQYTQFGGLVPQVMSFTNNIPPFLDIVIPNNGQSVAPTITTSVSCCEGQTIVCSSGIITDVREEDCDCVNPFITGGWINYDPATDIYTLCINFTSAPNEDHDIYYIQQDIVNPAIYDEGTETVTDQGYYEIVIDPELFFTEVQYYVKVTNECGYDYTTIKLKRCHEFVEFPGGQSYPTSMTIAINPYVLQNIAIEPASVPDRFVVEIGGVSVLDTGYIGNASYQTQLNTALATLGLPPSTITPVIGIQNYSFNNPTAALYMQLKVYAPLENTSWSVTTDCASAPPNDNLITLIVENTAGSNVQTVQVHGAYAVPGSTINFSPLQNPTETDTYLNQPGWIGAINAGVIVKPIVQQNRRYIAEVLKNGVLIGTNNYSYGGLSNFHLQTLVTGIVNGDTVRIRISSVAL